MRRLLIRDAAGNQVGEGVQFARGNVCTDGPLYAGDMARFQLMLTGGQSIEWLDPEPAQGEAPVPGVAIIDGVQYWGELTTGPNGVRVFRRKPAAP